MTMRKGLGKGMGCGYKNLIGKDPIVHRMAAKGVKQPQAYPDYIYHADAKTMPISLMQSINRAHGSHFFDKGALRFFDGKIESSGFKHGDTVLFVTSEQFHWSEGSQPRKYSVREMNLKDGSVETVAGFQAFGTKQDAQRIIKLMLEGMPAPKEDIGTGMGKAEYYSTEVENKEGRWNDSYATKDGFWVTHHDKYHHVYKIPAKVMAEEMGHNQSNLDWYWDKQGHLKGKKFRVVLLSGGGGHIETSERYFRTKESADKFIRDVGLQEKNQRYTGGFM
ncbi:hypothetical protein MUP79_06475 [Candidatus Bathyarchaeota archaeon]|nr:hypothetical protein [Candidatus Bathyarchaeota archaeon]